MLKEFLQNNITIVDNVSNWEEALQIGAKTLLDNKNIEERYITSIIDNVKKNGPYIVITEGVAMPHSRPEEGVIKKGMSFLKVKQGVDFPDTESKVYLFFTLAAENADGHQDAIAELSDLLVYDEKLDIIIKEDLKAEDILSLL